MMFSLERCDLCPRKCLVNRNNSKGVCGCSRDVYVARAMLHMWEEPCISGKKGSGAVFFCGCPLGCVFCQNGEISRPVILNDDEMKSSEVTVKTDDGKNNGRDNVSKSSGLYHGTGFSKGRLFTKERLVEVFLELQDKGAHNINLVSPTQYTPHLIDALELARTRGLSLPIVWNTGGYERPETIKALYGIVDVFLCDIKYFSPFLSKELSGASDYAGFALKSLREMFNITGKVRMDENSIIKSGVIVRHLVLPGCRHDSVDVLRAVADNIPADSVIVSLMRQYTPDFFRGCADKKLNGLLKRRVTSFEYDYVVGEALSLGFNGYIQDKRSASDKYVPVWGD